jgi:uncharacterized membrane protein
MDEIKNHDSKEIINSVTSEAKFGLLICLIASAFFFSITGAILAILLGINIKKRNYSSLKNIAWAAVILAILTIPMLMSSFYRIGAFLGSEPGIIMAPISILVLLSMPVTMFVNPLGMTLFSLRGGGPDIVLVAIILVAEIIQMLVLFFGLYLTSQISSSNE